MNMLLLRLNFLLALGATTGSLYFSEVLGFPPCVLCWYQRILLYPLVLIFAVGLWTEDASYRRYAYPMAALGFAIAAYHNLLYFGLIAEDLAPCTPELSCKTQQLNLFGFITIPLMALFGFLSIITVIWFESRMGKANEK